jgi:hypothetical protein
MTIEAKLLTLVVLLFGVIPFLVALLYKQLGKHGLLVGYLYSVLSISLLPLALRAFGSTELEALIDGESQSFSEALLSIMRIASYSVLFSVGGASFIAKMYEAITGQKLEKIYEKIDEKDKETKASIKDVELQVEQQSAAIKAVENQSAAIAAVAVVGSDDAARNSGGEKLRRILETIDAADDDGLSLPDTAGLDAAMEINKLKALGALKVRFRALQNDNRLYITEYGKRILKEMKETVVS